MIKLINIGQLVTYDSITESMQVFEDIEVIIENDIIIEIGSSLRKVEDTIDCENKLVTPGFVDSHTHPVFYDTRESEFQLRLQGHSYKDIAALGGGIRNSVSDVRNASELELIERVKVRMDTSLSLGTTTIECKSGYGLDTESELKSLEVIHKVNDSHPIDMVPTFMGAHAFPDEFENDHEGYVDLICNEMIPEIAKQGIAIFNDVFCEKGYFDLMQTRKIINAGKKYGLLPRIHADEFENSCSAQIAGELNSISADHLMMVSDEGIKLLLENNVIATLLPGTTFFLGKTSYAPYSKLKRAGVEIALATDYNPGSCNIQSMAFIISLACIYLKMDVLDALKSCTYISAKSLMLEQSVGSIEKGKNADLLIWGVNKLEQIPYTIDYSHIKHVLKNGALVFTA